MPSTGPDPYEITGGLITGHAHACLNCIAWTCMFHLPRTCNQSLSAAVIRPLLVNYLHPFSHYAHLCCHYILSSRPSLNVNFVLALVRFSFFPPGLPSLQGTFGVFIIPIVVFISVSFILVVFVDWREISTVEKLHAKFFNVQTPPLQAELYLLREMMGQRLYFSFYILCILRVVPFWNYYSLNLSSQSGRRSAWNHTITVCRSDCFDQYFSNLEYSFWRELTPKARELKGFVIRPSWLVWCWL